MTDNDGQYVTLPTTSCITDLLNLIKLLVHNFTVRITHPDPRQFSLIAVGTYLRP